MTWHHNSHLCQDMAEHWMDKEWIPVWITHTYSLATPTLYLTSMLGKRSGQVRGRAKLHTGCQSKIRIVVVQGQRGELLHLQM